MLEQDGKGEAEFDHPVVAIGASAGGVEALHGKAWRGHIAPNSVHSISHPGPSHCHEAQTQRCTSPNPHDDLMLRGMDGVARP